MVESDQESIGTSIRADEILAGESWLAPQLSAAEKVIADWLRYCFNPGEVFELRALNVKRTYGRSVTVSGFYDYEHIDQAAKSAVKLTNHGIERRPAPGVYFVINPVKPDLLARRANRCDIAEAGSLTTDDDVVLRRWILIDVDPVRPSNISATDEEKEFARGVALTAGQYLIGLGWPKPVIVDSGNGWHLYFRIDVPVDDGDLIKSVLHSLADRFDTPQAKIDTAVFNPSRISKTPGTKSRKGDDIAGRPHRWSQIIHVPSDVATVSVDQLESLAAEWRAKQLHQTNAHASKGIRLGNSANSSGGKAPIIKRAEAYIATVPPSISGQRGSDAAFKVACRLVKDFALSIDDAFPLFARWNETCRPPWSDAELRHKLQGAFDKGGETGALIRPNKATGDGSLEELYKIDDPRRLATLFLETYCTETRERRLLRWNSQWFFWNFIYFASMSVDEVKAPVVNLIQKEFEMDAIARLQDFNQASHDEKAKPPMAKQLNNNIVNNVMTHLAAMTTVPASTNNPSWLRNSPEGFDPRQNIVAQNGIVNLHKFVIGNPDYLIPLTPAYFCTSCLPFAFDPNPPEPRQWLRFLNELWPNDPESIQCLQEWMGLLLVPDNRFGKILLVVGPRRSGKGTIGRVIEALVGESNVAGPTLGSLATNFGLWSLLGKQVAIIGDARLSGKTDSTVVTERLLTISGDNALTVDRKNLPPVTTTLNTRFVMMTNELPRLSDASNALSGRFIILRMVNSFYGQEDHNLTERLMQELSSILIWAISGWQRLIENNRFTIPQSSADMTNQLEDAASPISAFIRERCDVGERLEVEKSSLFDAWKEWCESEGRAHPGTLATFSIQLRSALPGCSVKRGQLLGVRIQKYVGLKLKSFETSIEELWPERSTGA